MSAARTIHLNAFDMTCVGHQSPGLWRHPDDQSYRYKDLEYWTGLAQVLERGFFDSLFIADVLGVYDVYQGSAEAAIIYAAQIPVNDPMLAVSAMAAVTSHLGFGITVSSTYEQPYALARKFGTLDHLSKGRVGWNIVTSYLDSAARNLGLDKQVPHEERYQAAEEFLEVCYKLWESSWEDGAVLRDKASGIFADPGKVHPIGHKGPYFTVPGLFLCEPSPVVADKESGAFLSDPAVGTFGHHGKQFSISGQFSVPRSPQGRPVILQAGVSPQGRDFASANADAIFSPTTSSTRPRRSTPTSTPASSRTASRAR